MSCLLRFYVLLGLLLPLTLAYKTCSGHICRHGQDCCCDDDDDYWDDDDDWWGDHNHCCDCHHNVAGIVIGVLVAIGFGVAILVFVICCCCAGCALHRRRNPGHVYYASGNNAVTMYPNQAGVVAMPGQPGVAYPGHQAYPPPGYPPQAGGIPPYPAQNPTAAPYPSQFPPPEKQGYPDYSQPPPTYDNTVTAPYPPTNPAYNQNIAT